MNRGLTGGGLVRAALFCPVAMPPAALGWATEAAAAIELDGFAVRDDMDHLLDKCVTQVSRLPDAFDLGVAIEQVPLECRGRRLAESDVDEDLRTHLVSPRRYRSTDPDGARRGAGLRFGSVGIQILHLQRERPGLGEGIALAGPLAAVRDDGDRSKLSHAQKAERAHHLNRCYPGFPSAPGGPYAVCGFVHPAGWGPRRPTWDER